MIPPTLLSLGPSWCGATVSAGQGTGDEVAEAVDEVERALEDRAPDLVPLYRALAEATRP